MHLYRRQQTNAFALVFNQDQIQTKSKPNPNRSALRSTVVLNNSKELRVVFQQYNAKLNYGRSVLNNLSSRMQDGLKLILRQREIRLFLPRCKVLLNPYPVIHLSILCFIFLFDNSLSVNPQPSVSMLGCY